MTWKEIKLATLQKIYSAEGTNIPTDDATKDYLAAMPYAANECLNMICTNKKHIVKSVDLDPDSGNVLGSFRKHDMKELTDDFFAFDGQVYYTEGNTHQRTTNYYAENNVILVNKDAKGIFTVYYRAYPEAITSETVDSYILPYEPDVCSILPLYIASQIYKEDDNGIATSLRNEFEVAYDRLSQETNAVTLESFNESGW